MQKKMKPISLSVKSNYLLHSVFLSIFSSDNTDIYIGKDQIINYDLILESTFFRELKKIIQQIDISFKPLNKAGDLSIAEMDIKKKILNLNLPCDRRPYVDSDRYDCGANITINMKTNSIIDFGVSCDT